MLYDLSNKRVLVAGHRGMVGAAIARKLAHRGCKLLLAPRTELDFEDQASVDAWFGLHRPQTVFLAAAKVGGINANSAKPVEFIERNLRIATNGIRAAHDHQVEKLIFLGSSCIYPRQAPQPIVEEALLSGPLEPTNQWYAIAKIAGIKLCEAYRRQYGDDFVSVMPCNLYGPGDNYHLENSHVPAALIRRLHESKVAGAKTAKVWGSGRPRREFMHVDDLADACVFVMEHYSADEMLNVGTGSDVTIEEFAVLIAKVVGYQGQLEFDSSRPDGVPQKLLNVGRIGRLGWTARIKLEEGLADAYQDFLRGACRES